MPYLTLTLTENLKLQLSPGWVASYDIQKGVGLFWDKHTHIYLLTYLLAPDPHGAQGLEHCLCCTHVSLHAARYKI